VIVAMDTFVRSATRAGHRGEWSGDVTGAGVAILTELDAVGNTTKAITKGIAIATAVLAATALFGSYRDAITSTLASAGQAAATLPRSFLYQVFSPNVLVGVIIGAAVRVHVLRTGDQRGDPRRRCDRVRGPPAVPGKPGIMEGTVRPEYGVWSTSCTRDSLRELATPGLLAILRTDRGRIRSRRRPAGRLPGRRDRRAAP